MESALSHAHIVDSCTRTSLARRFRLVVVDDTEVIFAGMER
ncbi:hypothetical protein [Fictibacillus sp. 5RED26]|nr:hypothetical protein [Fictibacillus sp. 5RED26]